MRPQRLAGVGGLRDDDKDENRNKGLTEKANVSAADQNEVNALFDGEDDDDDDSD